MARYTQSSSVIVIVWLFLAIHDIAVGLLGCHALGWVLRRGVGAMELEQADFYTGFLR